MRLIIFLVGIAIGLSMQSTYSHIEYIPVEICEYDTIYRDTCDSEFKKHIVRIESNFNSKAVGDNGRAYGLYQQHRECVQDVNQVFGTNYTHADMFIPEKAEDVFWKYLEIGAIEWFIKKNHSLNIKHDEFYKTLAGLHNGGAYGNPKRSATNPYIRKFITYSRRIRDI